VTEDDDQKHGHAGGNETTDEDRLRDAKDGEQKQGNKYQRREIGYECVDEISLYLDAQEKGREIVFRDCINNAIPDVSVLLFQFEITSFKGPSGQKCSLVKLRQKAGCSERIGGEIRYQDHAFIQAPVQKFDPNEAMVDGITRIVDSTSDGDIEPPANHFPVKLTGTHELYNFPVVGLSKNDTTGNVIVFSEAILLPDIPAGPYVVWGVKADRVDENAGWNEQWLLQVIFTTVMGVSLLYSVQGGPIADFDAFVFLGGWKTKGKVPQKADCGQNEKKDQGDRYPGIVLSKMGEKKQTADGKHGNEQGIQNLGHLLSLRFRV